MTHPPRKRRPPRPRSSLPTGGRLMNTVVNYPTVATTLGSWASPNAGRAESQPSPRRRSGLIWSLVAVCAVVLSLAGGAGAYEQYTRSAELPPAVEADN